VASCVGKGRSGVADGSAAVGRGLVAVGLDFDLPVPVTGLAANFSPMPWIAPPPLGNGTAGGENRSSCVRPVVEAAAPPATSGDLRLPSLEVRPFRFVMLDTS
jgi:hypothetical protein